MGKRSRKPVDPFEGLDAGWGYYLDWKAFSLQWGLYEPLPGYMPLNKFNLFFRFWTPYLHVWWYEETKLRIGKW